MLIRILVVSTLIVLVSFLFLGMNIIFLKRKFPETSVGHNKNMKELGITCVKCEELAKVKTEKNKIRINPKELRMVID